MRTLAPFHAGLCSAFSNFSLRIAGPLLVLGTGLALASPCAGAPFTFSDTGSMATQRRLHTATLLPNGKVLVAGGSGNNNADLASAELYDPATGTWSATGNLNTARRDHTATLLPNGMVLVAGGFAGNDNLASAELYNSATGMWTATGSLNTGRGAHTATLLPNGKVLVAGGFNDLASAELYDPATGTWSATGDMNAARSVGHTATSLPNGMVLVAGGQIAGNDNLASAELYDPTSGTWASTGDMSGPRSGHRATLLPSGKVLVAGGYSGGSTITFLSSAELYDPASGTWTTTDNLNTGRIDSSATLLPNGMVLVAGGLASASPVLIFLSSAELYDPASGTWAATGSMATPRIGYTATLLPNGKVLVAGGSGAGFVPLASAELYDSADGNWTGTGDLITARSGQTATLLPNGKVLVAGGSSNNNAALAKAELYDPASGMWSVVDSMSTVRQSHTATLLPNGKVLVAGGSDGANVVASAEFYDPATGTWSATGDMTNARTNHTATLLPDGKVLVAGGVDGTNVLASAELYDPASGTWSATSDMTAARYIHTATLLPNGMVLVAGGIATFPVVLASAELYDPTSGTWATTGDMSGLRALHEATLLPSGKVLVAGGLQSPSPVILLSSAELYDPASGTWGATGSMSTIRDSHTATLLPNGKVLVAGGFGGGPLASAEVYDPASGTWDATGSMAAPRFGHTATLLPNGKVLAAGSFSASASAELYDVGLGFDSAWQPQITSALQSGNVLKLTGTLFEGVSQASSGNTQDSSTNYPLVQLRSLDSGQVAFLSLNPMSGWSDTAVGSRLLRDFPRGPALVTVFTNGIPSAARYLLLADPTELLNLSARIPVGTGNNLGIGGFIIRGNDPRQILVRALGPSLNLAGPLADPIIEIFDAQRQSLARNDNWQSDQAMEIAATGLRPTNANEAAVLITLPPGAFTAVVSGAGDTTGNALVEIFALPGPSDADLGNLSARGPVQTGNDLLIGGIIIRGGAQSRLLIRALGPELAGNGVAGPLQDPTLELYNGNGVLLRFNDDWQDTQSMEIAATGVAPTDSRSAAILATLSAGPYTAIVRGKNNTTGVALVEAFNLP